jgi:hypothetical protein
MQLKRIRVEINKGLVCQHEYKNPIEIADNVDMFGALERAINQIKRDLTNAERHAPSGAK